MAISQSVLINAKTGEQTVTEYDDGIYPPTPEELLAAARASASLTRMEFFTALESIGLFDAVWAMQDEETVPKLTRIMIRTASSFDRMHPELVSMAAAMGITDEQLDALYGIGVPE